MPRRAFTLIEIILALALIAALTGLVAGVAGVGEEAFSSRPPDRVLVSAVKAARAAAMEKGRRVALSFDSRGFFVVADADTAELFERVFLSKNLKKLAEEAGKNSEEVDWDKYPCNVKISFFAVPPEIINAASVAFKEDEALRLLLFYPDSTMTPARAVVAEGDGAEPLTFEFDPFCAALKGAKDER